MINLNGKKRLRKKRVASFLQKMEDLDNLQDQDLANQKKTIIYAKFCAHFFSCPFFQKRCKKLGLEPVIILERFIEQERKEMATG